MCADLIGVDMEYRSVADTCTDDLLTGKVNGSDENIQQEIGQPNIENVYAENDLLPGENFEKDFVESKKFSSPGNYNTFNLLFLLYASNCVFSFYILKGVHSLGHHLTKSPVYFILISSTSM